MTRTDYVPQPGTGADRRRRPAPVELIDATHELLVGHQVGFIDVARGDPRSRLVDTTSHHGIPGDPRGELETVGKFPLPTLTLALVLYRTGRPSALLPPYQG